MRALGNLQRPACRDQLVDPQHPVPLRQVRIGVVRKIVDEVLVVRVSGGRFVNGIVLRRLFSRPARGRLAWGPEVRVVVGRIVLYGRSVEELTTRSMDDNETVALLRATPEPGELVDVVAER